MPGLDCPVEGLCSQDGPVVVMKEIPSVHTVVVGSEVVAGKRNDGEVVVVDTCSLRFITNGF